MRYQTEIHVSPDRYVCLQLPTFFPEGKAVVTVTIVAENRSESTTFAGEEVDREDIEWWEDADDRELGRFT